MFVLSHSPAIFSEENKLRNKFPDEYDKYAKTVPRFWPRLKRMTVPDSVTFSPKTFNRAVLDCGAILSVYILAHLMEYAQNVGVVPIFIRNVR